MHWPDLSSVSRLMRRGTWALPWVWSTKAFLSASMASLMVKKDRICSRDRYSKGNTSFRDHASCFATGEVKAL